MNEQGWISIHRQLKNHWIWQDPVKLKWWLDILLSANHTPAKVNIGNELIECGKGQSIKSLQTWASEWRTSKDTVRNFFKLLEKDKMISLENMKVSTRLTVCKYDTYQVALHDKQTPNKRKPSGKQTSAYPNNNGNNENNENNLFIKPELTLEERELLEISEENRERWGKFKKWFNEYGFEEVIKIEKQLTPKQLAKLFESYGASEIKDTLLRMENYTGSTKYTSVYLTINNWLKRETAA